MSQDSITKAAGLGFAAFFSFGAAVLLTTGLTAQHAPSGGLMDLSHDVAGVGIGTQRRSLSSGDLSLVTRTLLGEAARQSDQEARAIAHVIFNRLESKRWGGTVASVVLFQEQRPSGRWTYAFTAYDPAFNAGRNVWGSGVERTKAWRRLEQLVREAWQARAPGGTGDPTNRAMHYWHPASMPKPNAIPRWARGRRVLAIGGARFVKLP